MEPRRHENVTGNERKFAIINILVEIRYYIHETSIGCSDKKKSQ